jgi:hypothetical protein
MNWMENDPDTLQSRDELDTDWVKLWRRATNKKRLTKRKLTFNVILPKKAIQRSAGLQYKKTR